MRHRYHAATRARPLCGEAEEMACVIVLKGTLEVTAGVRERLGVGRAIVGRW